MANKERKDLNTTNGDLGNDYATSSVPISQRRGFFGTAMVWVGWCISLSAFLTGGTIGAGNTLWIGLLAVLAGNLLLFVLGSLCGVIGFRTGRTTYSLFEPMFGSKGSIFVSVLRGASAMSFIGVLLNSFANTLTALLPWFPFWLAVLLFGIAILSTSIRGIKVGLDCANGASWNIAKSVFDALGADTYVINNQPNGLNINLNAGSTHIEGLQKFVVEKGLDVGFAYDGDADRCLCVDEKGNVITGDHILYIYGCYMKERGKLLTNTVVTTVMSNFGLYKAFDEQGIGYAKTAVGDKYVYEYMAKNSCRIGGEQSGHIIFSKYASTGDGILTSLKMMEVMLAKKKPLSALAAPLKIYPQVLENVRVTDKKAAQDDAAVQAAVKAVAEALGDTGRILVRESGTEPVVRVMVEAPDHDTCQKYVSQVVDVIKAQGYSV